MMIEGCSCYNNFIYGGEGMKNYLFDLYPDFPDGFSLENRKDPDRCSKELYNDLKKALFNEEAISRLGLIEVKNKEQDYGNKFYTLFVNTDQFLLSSDYIGPSIYWAEKAGLNEEEIISFLIDSRTLGGHLVWPRGENEHIIYRNKYGKQNPVTVNTARGGEKGYFDRIDLTLYAIKQYYNEKEIVNSYMYQAMINYDDWFDMFKGDNPFKNFIDFFKLQDFVSENYEVYDLTTFNDSNGSYGLLNDSVASIPKTKEGYRRFIKGSNFAVCNRNKRM